MQFEYSCEGNAIESCTISASGQIVEGTAQSFIDQFGGTDAFYIDLSSPGGNLAEGVALGRAIREAGLYTRIYGQCLSACAYAFLGGTVRSFSEPDALGFHQFAAQENIPDTVTQRLAAEVLSYVLEMGVDARIFVTASQTGPDAFFFVDPEEAVDLGILPPPPFTEVDLLPRGGGVVAFATRQVPLEPYDRSARIEFFCRQGVPYVDLFAAGYSELSSFFDYYNLRGGLIVVDGEDHEIDLGRIEILEDGQHNVFRFSIPQLVADRISLGREIYVDMARARAEGSTVRFNLEFSDIERATLTTAFDLCISESDTEHPSRFEGAQTFGSCWLSTPTASVVNVSEYVNLRRRPDFYAPVIREVPLGEQVRPTQFDSVTIIGDQRSYDSCVTACQAFSRNPDDRAASERAQQCINDNLLWYEVADTQGNRGWVSRRFLREVQ
jgi:hypothetical protein